MDKNNPPAQTQDPDAKAPIVDASKNAGKTTPINMIDLDGGIGMGYRG